MTRNVFLMAVSQASVMTTVGLCLSASAFVGQMLGNDFTATLPLSLLYLTTMLTLYPAALLSARNGRRVIFVLGGVFGTFGALVSGWAILIENMVLFCLGSVMLGVFFGTGQYFRFAAAESVPEDKRAAAIAHTMLGGLLAAFLGPWLGEVTRTAGPLPFSASFFSLAAVTGMAVLCAVFFLEMRGVEPAEKSENMQCNRSLREIYRNSTALMATLCAAGGYMLMNLVMTAMPLAAKLSNLPFATIALIMQFHLVAMFLPSLVTGELIRHFGFTRVAQAGCLLLVSGSIFGTLGASFPLFLAALIFVGLGWNLLYISGSTILLRAFFPAEKAKVQAFNDIAVFGSVTIATFLASPLLLLIGWAGLNVAIAILTCLVMGVVSYASRSITYDTKA